jgi:hypothetical protein
MVQRVLKRNTMRGREVRRTLCAKLVGEAVGTIDSGCEIYGLTKGQWSLIDLIEYCLEATGPAELVISTWTAANADITFANRLFKNGAITGLRFLVDFSFPSRQPAYCAALRESFGDEAVRLTKNHAKFVLITNATWSLVVRTSMNLNENRRLENFEISDSAEMADFLLSVINEIFEEQKETFKKRPTEHTNAFLTQWGEKRAEDSDQNDPGVSQYFGDGTLDLDLRRTGVTYD